MKSSLSSKGVKASKASKFNMPPAEQKGKLSTPVPGSPRGTNTKALSKKEPNRFGTKAKPIKK